MTKHPNGYRRANSEQYQRKSELIGEHAKALMGKGELVTHSAIMCLLDEKRPGHRTYPIEISRALHGVIPKAKRARSGCGVEVKGAVYPSISSAARAEKVSMETVRKRTASPNFPDWKRID